MKTNLLFFALLLISTTLTHTSHNPPVAGNGSFRLPPNKNFGKPRHNASQEPSKSAHTDSNKS